MSNKPQNYVQDYFARVKRSIDEMESPEYIGKIDKIVEIFLNARANRNQIFVMGNGGSGATASHLMCDLGKMTINPDSPRFRVIALTDNIPIILDGDGFGKIALDYTNTFAFKDFHLNQTRSMNVWEI